MHIGLGLASRIFGRLSEGRGEAGRGGAGRGLVWWGSPERIAGYNLLLPGRHAAPESHTAGQGRRRPAARLGVPSLPPRYRWHSAGIAPAGNIRSRDASGSASSLLFRGREGAGRVFPGKFTKAGRAPISHVCAVCCVIMRGRVGERGKEGAGTRWGWRGRGAARSPRSLRSPRGALPSLFLSPPRGPRRGPGSHPYTTHFPHRFTPPASLSASPLLCLRAPPDPPQRPPAGDGEGIGFNVPPF